MYVSHHAIDTTLDYLIDKEVALEGIIIAEPDKRASVTHYVVDITNSDMHVRMTARQFPALQYGDRVRVHGVLQFPENITQDSGITFAYIGFLAKDSIRYIMKTTYVERIATQQGNAVLSMLYAWKQTYMHALIRLLEQPEGALASGILLGAKQSLGNELVQAFQRSGLIHIIVLSGSNVAIITDTVRVVLRRLPPTLGTITTILFICVFAAMTGASATTIRASIMALLSVIAFRYARTYNVHRALNMACTLMLLQNPRILLYDPGFQLSFLATVGLIYVTPLIEPWCKRCIPQEALCQIVASTIATQLTVAPLIITMTGTISIISLLTNVLVVPIVPLAMAFSAVVPLMQYINPWGLSVIIIAKSMLLYIITIATFFGSLPFATIRLR